MTDKTIPVYVSLPTSSVAYSELKEEELRETCKLREVIVGCSKLSKEDIIHELITDDIINARIDNYNRRLKWLSKHPDYNIYTVPELKGLYRLRRMKGYSRMNKKELISHLDEFDENLDSSYDNFITSFTELLPETLNFTVDEMKEYNFMFDVWAADKYGVLAANAAKLAFEARMIRNSRMRTSESKKVFDEADLRFENKMSNAITFRFKENFNIL